MKISDQIRQADPEVTAQGDAAQILKKIEGWERHYEKVVDKVISAIEQYRRMMSDVAKLPHEVTKQHGKMAMKTADEQLRKWNIIADDMSTLKIDLRAYLDEED